MGQRTGERGSSGTGLGFAIGALLTVFGSIACSREDERASERLGSTHQALSPIAIRTFGFESLADWTAAGATRMALSSDHSEGASSLALTGGGWMEMTSRALSKELAAPSVIGYDVRVADHPLNPYWYGSTEIFVNAPSVGIWNQLVGHAELTPLPPGHFQRVEFTVPTALRTKLGGNYNDLTLRIAVNVSSGEPASYLIDRFTFGPASQCTPQPDGNPCTDDICDNGVPAWPLRPVGAACDTNATVCDGVGTCSAAGACQIGPAPSIDDGNPCTSDACDPVSGVVHLPVATGVTCETDGDVCNGTSRCDGAGACAPGSPPALDDGNPCTADSCDPAAGVQHVAKPVNTSCDSDANLCNGGAVCNAAAVCVAQPAPSIDDGNSCTADSCDPASGVHHAPATNGTACDDGNACTWADTCQAGACAAGAPTVCVALDQCHVAGICDPSSGVCTTPAKADGAACSDGDACTLIDTCSNGACSGTNAVVCAAQDACHTAGACDAATGACSNPAVPNGVACDDATVCNGRESCQNGSCVAATPPPLDDGNPCTADACDSVTGVTHVAVTDGTSCDSDGDACNGVSACSSGVCTAGSPPSTDDGNPCTVDSCDAATGVKHLAAANGAACSDGNACTSDDQCQAGACVAGAPKTCAAVDQCHSEGACDPTSGACSSPVKADGSSCDDGDACTLSDACQGGACQGSSPVVCAALDACHTVGACDSLTGSCSNPTAPNGLACDDATVCNGRESCQNGTCVATTPPPLDDGNPCTADACDPAAGVVHLPVAQGVSCDDGNACNGVSRCDGAGSCQAGVPPVLDGGTVCLTVTCTPEGGVVSTPAPVGTACDSDSDPCNGTATCDGQGACEATSVPVVDDGNPCTVDSCDSMSGVKHEPAANGTACQDGNACTEVDTCQAGACVGGSPKPCEAAGPCQTAGACEPTTGTCKPVAKPDGESCNDGNACTQADRCLAGACQPGSPMLCGSADPCQAAGVCEPSTGACSVGAPKPDGASCDDGSLCNGRETCSAGACITATPPAIDDADVCTVDSCDEATGARHVPIALPDDGDPATTAFCDPVTGSVTHVRAPGSPVLEAPPLDTGALTSFTDLTGFLYEGSGAVQTKADGSPIDPNLIKAEQGGWLIGSVRDASGAALAGVTVKVAGADEFGQSHTRPDGGFDLIVNGGRERVVRFEKEGYLPVDRKVYVGWKETVATDDVVMLSLEDSPPTSIELGVAAPFQVAIGSETTDADGDRGGVLMVPAGTGATLVMPDNSTLTPTQLTLRLTEYTVGEDGPARMPAPLPPTSGYTYAIEISADEAMAAGASRVNFNQPTYFYLDDFLDLPLGTIVPNGYYDRQKQAWVASANGYVIQILAVSAGSASVDTGGAPITLANDELQQLATLVSEGRYAVGAKLWRVPIDHLTPWDCNFARSFECDGDCDEPPADTEPDDEEPKTCEDKKEGSIINCQSQSLGETLPVAGTPFRLNYRSRLAAPGRRLRINARPVAADDEVEIEVTIAGRRWVSTFTEGPARTWDFKWDGLDAAGRKVIGTVTATVQYRWYHTRRYLVAAPSFGSPPTSPPTWRRERTLDSWSDTARATYQLAAGALQGSPRAEFLGGWTLDAYHSYDPDRRILYMGSGEIKPADSVYGIARLVMGSGGGSEFPPDGSSATTPGGGLSSSWEESLVVAPNGDVIFSVGSTGIRRIAAAPQTCNPPTSLGPLDHCLETISRGFFADISGIALGPDGSLFVSDRWLHRVYRLRPTSTGGFTTPEVFAGSTGGFAGDGGPATSARLRVPTELTVAPDGTVYIADTLNRRVRRVDPAGNITTAVGNGNTVTLADNGKLGPSVGIWETDQLALAPDGSLYLGFNRIANPAWLGRLGPDGTFAWLTKTTTGAAILEGKLSDYRVIGLGGLAVRPNGNLLVADNAVQPPGFFGGTVREVDRSGNFVTLSYAGNVPAADGIPTLGKGPRSPEAIAVAPDGTVLVMAQNSIYRISNDSATAATLCSTAEAEYLLPAEDEGLCFDKAGRHLRTVDIRTGQPLLVFAHDGSGALANITDANGRVTTIEKQSNRYRIVAPGGQATSIALDAAGHASAISDSMASVALVMDDDGQLTSMVDARGIPYLFTYGSDGRLLSDESPFGRQTLARTILDSNGREVLHQTPLGRATKYTVVPSWSGARSTTLLPDGGQIVRESGINGDLVVTTADGIVTTVAYQPDPRFGVQASYPATQTTRLPSGLTRTTTDARLARTFDAGTQKWNEQRVLTVGGSATTIARSYDMNGQTIVTTNAAGLTTRQALDAAGNTLEFRVGTLTPVVLGYASGKLTSKTQGARTVEFEFVPDDSGRADAGYLKATTDSVGIRTELESDLYGRVIKQLEAKDTTVAATTLLRWGSHGKLEQLTMPQGQQHNLIYGPGSLLQEYVPPILEDVQDPSTTFEFSADRQPILETRADGLSVSREYNPVTGKLDLLRFATASGTTRSITYQYYAANNVAQGMAWGRLSGMTGPYGVNLAFQYDGHLPTRETWSGDVSGNVSFEYNAQLLRKREVVTPGVGAASSYYFGYDADRKISCVSSSAAATCNPLAATDLKLTWSPIHGQISELRLGDVIEQNTYSDTAEDVAQQTAFGELRRQVVTVRGVTVFDLVYDAPTARRDDLRRIRHARQDIINPTTLALDSRELDMAYDARQRLGSVFTQVGGLGSEEVFEYDGNGNRTALLVDGEPSVDYRYDDQDRLVSFGDSTVTYGANGEAINKSGAGGSFAYEYDALGNLIRVTKTVGATTTIIDYLVDGKGRRVGKRVNGVLQKRWLYGQQLSPAAELDAAGNLVARYLYGSRQNVPDVVTRGGQVYRLIGDQLGSPRLAVNVANPNDMPFRADYSAFGEMTGASGVGWIPFGFAGGLYDADTGLVRFGARDYDPSVGRWLSKDPSRFDGGQANIYVYANNDPVNFVDRDGRFAAVAGALAGPVGWAAIGIGVTIIAIIGLDGIIENDNGDPECVLVNEDPLSNTCTYECSDGTPRVIQRELPEDISANICPTNDVEVCPKTLSFGL
jgi:RHS repeat-associated protein